MEATAITAVSQFLNEGRLRFGPIDGLEVAEELWEQAMDEVTAAGGEVGYDHCMVDGVAVRQLPPGQSAQAAFVLPDGRRETLA
jgi:hypothetical protein